MAQSRGGVNMNPSIEVNILVALLRAATDQTRMLNGHFKHKKKLSFSNMQEACEHWLKLSDMNAKYTPEEQEFTDNLTDAIHEVCDYLRDEMAKIIKQNEGQNSTASDS